MQSRKHKKSPQKRALLESACLYLEAAGAGVGVAAASGACLGAGAGMAGAMTVLAGALIDAGAATGVGGAACASPWNFITSGTISSATMLMILISGLMAGPAVSL